MADPNQTPARGDWLCPCSGCSKSITAERKQIIEMIKTHRLAYLEYRGSGFSDDGQLLWAKDDALAYIEALDKIIVRIEERNPKPKTKPKQQ
jgi:hypothetical protein